LQQQTIILYSVWDWIPIWPGSLPNLKISRMRFFLFCKAIIDATASYACAFKPQIAYFAALAAEDQLQAICDYLKQNYPDIPIVLDAKRRRYRFNR
jgi:hypothetical protein